MKFICTHQDYCPCIDCDDKWVKEQYNIGTKRRPLMLDRIKGDVSKQTKERVKLIPEEVRKSFYEVIDEGKTLGEAKNATNIGLMAAGELAMEAINHVNFYRNPFRE